MFDTVLFLSQLQQKTISKEIKWKVVGEQNIPNALKSYSNDFIVTCFFYYDKHSKCEFYIYTYRTRYYTDEDEYHFVAYNNLVLIQNDQIIYEFGDANEVSNLLKQIQAMNLSSISFFN